MLIVRAVCSLQVVLPVTFESLLVKFTPQYTVVLADTLFVPLVVALVAGEAAAASVKFSGP